MIQLSRFIRLHQPPRFPILACRAGEGDETARREIFSSLPLLLALVCATVKRSSGWAASRGERPVSEERGNE